MESTGNFYDNLRKRNTPKTDAPTITQAQNMEDEISDSQMTYHYQTGTKRTINDRFAKYLWRAITLFAIVMTYDIIFNYSRLFIKILIWTSR